MNKEIRTAFILAAGLGLRLRPLTEHCPKPLLPVRGRPIITYVMDHLIEAGVEHLIVNTHHCAEAYEKAFPDQCWKGIPVQFRYEPVLLDTAGGLKNIEELWKDDRALLVHNGDIMTDLPIGKLIAAHQHLGMEVTLALRTEGPLRNIALDDEGRICDMRNLLGSRARRHVCFTGIYVVERCFLERLKKGLVESIIPVFVRMLRENPGSIGHLILDEGSWSDIGTISEYQRIAGLKQVEAK